MKKITHAAIAEITETESPEKWGARMQELNKQHDTQILEDLLEIVDEIYEIDSEPVKKAITSYFKG